MSSKPIYLKVEQELNVPLSKVWETVALGFGNVADYNPEIKTSRFDSDLRSGIGTKRHCDTPDGGFLKEEIIQWEDERYFKLKLNETSFPMALIESKFSFNSNGGRTMITQEFWYRMKSPMGWMSGLMKGKMKKTLNNGLHGLKQYLEQNQ